MLRIISLSRLFITSDPTQKIYTKTLKVNSMNVSALFILFRF